MDNDHSFLHSKWIDHKIFGARFHPIHSDLCGPTGPILFHSSRSIIEYLVPLYCCHDFSTLLCSELYHLTMITEGREQIGMDINIGVFALFLFSLL